MPQIVNDLRNGLEFEETHISWVFLGPTEVWKVKRPVDLGFLDFTGLENRRLACEAEVTLNRRLAPHVYLGVTPVLRDENGKCFFGESESGEVVDWAVHMVRLPAADRLDHRLAGRLPPAHLRALARLLSDFHARARCDAETARFGSPEAVALNVEENFAQAREALPRLLGPVRARELEARQGAFLREHAELFRRRALAGRVRDGHGDLRLGQIYLDGDGAVSILDCIEFNDRFRYGDVCGDIAFLSMDLSAHGRVDLAEQFLAAYAEASGDFDLYALVDFYEGYRACVRGKIAFFLAEDPGYPDRKAAMEEARRYFLAAAVPRRPAPAQRLLLVGGNIASGKSTVAGRLGEALAAPVIASDRVRKQMAGIDPLENREAPMGQGLYGEAFTAEVYAEALRCAGAVLASGRTAIVDASFSKRAQRDAARHLAASMGVPFVFIECRVEEAVARERLMLRGMGPAVSDGRASLYADFSREREAVQEIPADRHILVDTGRPLEESMKALARLASP